jgi:hypothetical protein
MSGQDSSQGQPKIIIDSDWKSQAQAEKERLSQKVDAKPAPKAGAAGAASGAGGAPGEQGGEAQEVGFQDLVSMLASQALMYMGFYPDPQTGQAIVSLEYARLHIDMLGVLEEKTKGNLDATEQQLITKLTGELRSAFVETSQMVAKAVKEGKAKQVGAPGTGPGVVRASGGAGGMGGIGGGMGGGMGGGGGGGFGGFTGPGR